MKLRSFTLLLTFIIAFSINLEAQKIPVPKDHFGFDIGDNGILF